MKKRGVEPVPLEEITARIEEIGLSIHGDTPLHLDEDVIQLQQEVRHYVAESAANLMTGMHKKSEQYQYMEVYNVYTKLLGHVALDMAHRLYDEHGDTGAVKRGVLGYVQQSKRQMVTMDYRKRLEMSRTERAKQWLATHKKTRFAGAFAVSGATTSGLFLASDNMAPILDLTRTQATGAAGIATVVAGLALRSLLRTGPTKAGQALSRQFNSTLETYRLDVAVQEMSEDEESIDDLPTRYAERHLMMPFGAAAIYLNSYDLTDTINGKSDNQFADMIQGTLRITEQSMIDSYGIDTDKLNNKSLLRRLSRR